MQRIILTIMIKNLCDDAVAIKKCVVRIVSGKTTASMSFE